MKLEAYLGLKVTVSSDTFFFLNRVKRRNLEIFNVSISRVCILYYSKFFFFNDPVRSIVKPVLYYILNPINSPENNQDFYQS